MHNIGQTTGLDWQEVTAPPDAQPPAPLTMRAQTLGPCSYFPDHTHDWGQLVYAISGVLTVGIAGQSLVISPDQAVWLPAGMVHRVGSMPGAEFRSLWIDCDAASGLPCEPVVYAVAPLLKALIAEVAETQGQEDEGAYADRLSQLILDQLHRAVPVNASLPWPRDEALSLLCEALYVDPADPRTTDHWARELGMSSRTLTRRFEASIGISLRSWRRRMRLFKAIEMLGGGMDVTSVAFELGYGSPSAFIYAFRTEMGTSPRSYMRDNKTQ